MLDLSSSNSTCFRCCSDLPIDHATSYMRGVEHLKTPKIWICLKVRRVPRAGLTSRDLCLTAWPQHLCKQQYRPVLLTASASSQIPRNKSADLQRNKPRALRILGCSPCP
ncbi:hypothetical protein RRG08_033689 [Elysia crispata]|uniref:Uncharacterized protein n=1 Tax=Elysia crispata TaxID=231223 RepID=A0AAE1A8T0_9GAST|nr:hypothetical protein RRG08_033689 [Elysia crispata]